MTVKLKKISLSRSPCLQNIGGLFRAYLRRWHSASHPRTPTPDKQAPLHHQSVVRVSHHILILTRNNHRLTSFFYLHKKGNQTRLFNLTGKWDVITTHQIYPFFRVCLSVCRLSNETISSFEANLPRIDGAS